MSGFSADWLTLREPLDAASRATSLCDAHLAAVRASDVDDAITVTDLACGTGANLRYLAPLLGGRQAWRLVDHDPALLAAAPDRMRRWAARIGASVGRAGEAYIVGGAGFDCEVAFVRADIVDALPRLDIPRASLVTASALLDLVSGEWLDALAERCRAAGASALFALTYDGRIEFEPACGGDAEVRDLVNRHQRTDKGFGDALGPSAVASARNAFAQRGYRVDTERSDWQLGPADRRLQQALIEGWFDAAVETAPAEADQLRSWRESRLAHVAEGRSMLRVGHEDLSALPGD